MVIKLKPLHTHMFGQADFIASTTLGGLIGILAPFILLSLDKHYPFQNYLVLIFGILAPLGLYIFSLGARWIPALYQFGKFGIVGSSNFLVDLGVLQLLIYFFSQDRSPQAIAAVAGITITTWTLFKCVSFIVASTNSFLWNKFWTFHEKKLEEARREYFTFLAISVVGLLINSTAFSIVFNFRPTTMREALWATVSAVAGAFAAMTWNFLGYKFIVFKNHE